MEQSEDPQQPLEITRGMTIVIVVLLTVGLASSMRHRNDRHVERIIDLPSDDPLTIVRSTGQPIELSQLGIVVTPTDGWSHLSVENGDYDWRPTFVNESHQAIARLNRFPFQSWPPSEKAAPDVVVESAEPESPRYDPRLDNAVIKVSHYEQFDVEWLEIEGQPMLGPGFRYGRLTADPIDLLITVLNHSSGPSADDSMQTLCDAIQPAVDSEADLE